MSPWTMSSQSMDSVDFVHGHCPVCLDSLDKPNRRDSSSGRASASCAVGQDGCRIDTWPRHTKDVIKMVPVATLLGAQHYKASAGFSSLTNHASLTSHNEQKKKKA